MESPHDGSPTVYLGLLVVLNDLLIFLCVSAGVGATEGSYEYLVFNSTLIGVAAKHGLKPVVDWGDPELADCFDEVGISIS